MRDKDAKEANPLEGNVAEIEGFIRELENESEEEESPTKTKGRTETAQANARKKGSSGKELNGQRTEGARNLEPSDDDEKGVGQIDTLGAIRKCSY